MEVSLALVVKLVMQDLDNYIEGKEEYLTTNIRDDIDHWFEWAVSDDVTDKEKEIILNELHECLNDMRVWAEDEEEYSEILNKINRYFEEKLENSEEVGVFKDIVINYYKEQIAEEWNI
jgi:hypothetical protein